MLGLDGYQASSHTFCHRIGASFDTMDPALVKKDGAATALEVRATGIPYCFCSMHCGLQRSKKGQGFVIIRLWEGIDRITYPPHTNYNYSILKSVNAGFDMRVKFAMGLFENPLADYRFADKLGSKVIVKSARRMTAEHRELASEAVRNSPC
ncbi:hypothetical protein NC651_019115 [Populus alba x Populus x berolinensis]|nr:hypothetical protein NC651_019115 [Populus alba x Populus x berolinensis]